MPVPSPHLEALPQFGQPCQPCGTVQTQFWQQCQLTAAPPALPGLSCSWTGLPAQHPTQRHPPRALSQQRRMTMNQDCSSSKVVQRHSLASTTPSYQLFLKVTLVPHHCTYPGQPGAQLLADIWGVRALQPCKGLNLPQSCRKLTGLSPSLMLSGPTAVEMQPEPRSNPTGRDPRTAVPISAECPDHQ